ncbi:MAG: hypothetical protein ABIJ81_04550, partial [Patescibacteria group bacterium]
MNNFGLFLWGLIYAVITIVAGAFIYLAVNSVIRIEKNLSSRVRWYAFEEIEDTWQNVRFLIAFVFWFFGWQWAMVISNLVGCLPKSGFFWWTGFSQLVIIIFALIGWWRLCWSLARLYLKRVAPTLYDIYKPYYSPYKRRKIEESEKA